MERTNTTRKNKKNRHSIIGTYKNMLTYEEQNLSEEIKDMAEITDIKVNKLYTKSKKIRSFIEQAGDPYCLRYGNAVIEMSYSEEGASLQECITAVFV